MAAEKRVELYPLADQFERAVVWLACTDRGFYGSTAHVLEAESMPHEQARLAVSAAHAVARDIGHGPSSALLVVQRLRRMVDDGKITIEQVAAVSDFLDAAEDAGVPDAESVAKELAPVLQRRAQMKAIITATETFSRRGDFATVLDMMEKAGRIGVADHSPGTPLEAAFSEIAAISTAQRAGTGVDDLDHGLDGGALRGQLVVYIGGAGAGKSMALAHTAAHYLRQGMSIFVATLELSRAFWFARVLANLLDIPINGILGGMATEGQRRLAALLPTLANRCVVKDMAAHAGTVSELRRYVEQHEQVTGKKVDAVIVDYADKLTCDRAEDRARGEYHAMRVVYEGLRLFGVEKDKWVWTASQSKAVKKGESDHLDLQHAADSMHKGRVADLVITLNPKETGINYYVAKNRTGRGNFTVGPVPVEFACARMAPIDYSKMPW